jgi:cell division protein FtsQ
MKLFNWTNTRLVLMIGILIFFFYLLRNENRKLTKSVVVFVGDNALCETVNKLLIENRDNASTIGKIK